MWWKSRKIVYLATASATAAAAGLTVCMVQRYRRNRDEREWKGIIAADKAAISWRPPTRTEIINQLKGKSTDGAMLSEKDAEYDLLIIGGGATGAGCALDAAARGLKVACIEREDYSSGTSSKSTKLVHGGVRYLQKAIMELDYEQYLLVKEALHERFTFLKIAPFLAQQLPIMLPVYKWYMVPYYWVGSKTYDLLSGNRGLESSYYLSKTKALEVFPMLKKDNLAGAVVYYDGSQNDSRMNIALALTALYYGASMINYVEAVNLIKETEGDGEKIRGAVVKDRMTGESFKIKAKGVINATGPFCDAIRRMDEPSIQRIVSPSSGTHIIFPGYFSPKSMGLVDPQTSDGRVIFFLPWQGNTIAGTTDSPCEITYSPLPTEKEIMFILHEVAKYLDPDVKVRRSDVLAAWSGIRPLVRDPVAKNTEALVRNHMINVSKSGLLTIAGGKWTTYRNMAFETINKAIEVFNLKPQRESDTEKIPIIGAHGYSDLMYIRLIQQYGLETDVAKHLASSYGDRAFAVAAMADETDRRWPLFGNKLVPWYPYIDAEVKYAVRNEFACTVVDVLARRTRLAFLNAQAAREAIPKVIDIMSKELNWSRLHVQQERADAEEFLKTMGLDPELPSRAAFTREEWGLFKKEFAKFDVNKDGRIGSDDFSKVLKKLSIKVDPPILDKIFAESHLDKEGGIDFNEFLDVMSAVKQIKSQSKLARLMADVQDKEPLTTERSGGGI